MIQQKLSAIFITLFLFFLMRYSSFWIANPGITLTLPLFFDMGHFSLATIYQFKQKKIDRKFFFKLLLSFLFIALMFFVFSNNMSRWLVYTLLFTHGLTDERFTFHTIPHKRILHYMEVFVPVLIYSILIWVLIWKINLQYWPISILTCLSIVFIVYKIFSINNLTFKDYYLNIFLICPTIALWFISKITLFSVVVLPIYYHYISWYFYYFTRTKNKKEYVALSLSVNLIIGLILFYFLQSHFSISAINILSFSLFIPSWAIFHCFTTYRIDSPSA